MKPFPALSCHSALVGDLYAPLCLCAATLQLTGFTHDPPLCPDFEFSGAKHLPRWQRAGDQNTDITAFLKLWATKQTFSLRLHISQWHSDIMRG